MYKLPSSLNNLVEAISTLPGIGPKSATRIALYLLKSENHRLMTRLSDAIDTSLADLSYCKECWNIVADGTELCSICADPNRSKELMIVENVLDLVNIEDAEAFEGKYHILGGVVSPVRAVNLESLNVEGLLPRLADCELVIFALPSSIEGDTTTLLLKELITETNPGIVFKKLGRGLPSGANIEFLDAETVRNSITNMTSIS